MTAQANTMTVSMDDVYDAMRKCYAEAIRTGRNWHAVTVGVDGIPYLREEVSRSESESEYFGRGNPHPVTVWSMKGDASVDADEQEATVDSFDPAEQFAGYGGVEEVIRKLEAAGFTVEL